MFDHETNRILREILDELKALYRLTQVNGRFLEQIELNTRPQPSTITGFTAPELSMPLVSLSPGNTATFTTTPIPATSAPTPSKITWVTSDTTNAPVSPNPADPTGLSTLVAFPTNAVVGTVFTLNIAPYTNSDGSVAPASPVGTFTIVAPPSPDVTGFTAPVQSA